MRTIVIGAGNLGIALIAHLTGEVLAVTRTAERHPALRAAGARPTTDWPTVAPTDRWVLALPGSDAQRAAVEALGDQPAPAIAVMVGTTGLHAPYTGTVGPDSPAGTGPRSDAAARAEQAFRAWAPHGTIVRCGGLWREGRGPAAAFARTRTAPPGPPDAPIPLIHYDAAAALIARVLGEIRPPSVVLGVTHAPRRDAFYGGLAATLGCDPPAYTEPVGHTARFVDPWALPDGPADTVPPR